jgi:hypothetical protein
MTQTKKSNKTHSTRFKVVKLDETHNYLDKQLVKKCGKIYGVYLYDENERTFCCSMSPDYWCMFLYAVAENEIDDDTDQELIETNCGGQDHYFSCQDIDNLSDEFKADASDCDGEYSLDEDDDNDDNTEHYLLVSEAIEACQSNHLIW